MRPEAIAEATEVCPYCNGKGVIAPTVTLDEQIENKVAYYAQDKSLRYVELRTSPYVASFLTKGFWSVRRRWSWRYKCRIKVCADQSIGFAETKYFDRRGVELT